jgi:hypothetical protein
MIDRSLSSCRGSFVRSSARALALLALLALPTIVACGSDDAVVGGGASPRADAGGGASAIACDPADVPDLSRCVPELSRLLGCFEPAGACTLQGGAGFVPDIVYANGARMEQQIDLTSGVVSTRYYGAGGVYCGQQVIETQGTTGMRVEDASGTSTTVAFEVLDDGGAIYVCADGSRLTVTPDDLDAIQACSGASSEDCSEGDPGDASGGLGSLCNDNAPCNAGLDCCGGVCFGGDCPFDGECETADDCEGGRVCCGTGMSATCTERDLCADGVCASDADCVAEEGVCCDGRCERDRVFCEGECRADNDCNDTAPYCCTNNPFQDPPLNYCAWSEADCYAGTTCEEDSECGTTGELVCCDNPDTVEGCTTAEACYANLPCSDASECGGLVCCDRSDFPFALCATEQDCALGTACESAADCGGGLTCCEAFGALACFPQEFCGQ